ncbi:hypothetical protein [Paenibacillus dokdonensis]|uniref:hypothetical protein n=1 Tax=Paenibacillus dokdonensis TaxID=2567944 RepID=UPI0010A8B3FB|nr:hypothetical protein [Paenibacillus dokdonensis]
MSNDQQKDENATFKESIEDNADAVREHSDSQPMTIKPNDERAGEHEWTELHDELYRSEVKKFMESLFKPRSEESKAKAKRAKEFLRKARDNSSEGNT